MQPASAREGETAAEKVGLLAHGFVLLVKDHVVQARQTYF
jgi:hypothetical protein